jgi:hypothetical protein
MLVLRWSWDFGANGLIVRNLADLKACQFTFSRAVTPAIRSAIDVVPKAKTLSEAMEIVRRDAGRLQLFD